LSLVGSGVGWSLMVTHPWLAQCSAVSAGTPVSVPPRCSPEVQNYGDTALFERVFGSK
jgi:hypothetical protein